jgi:nucleotide-binding universal stress UspA family protein
MKRILVPVDGSDIATKALDFGIERAKLHGAQLTIAFSMNIVQIAASSEEPADVTDPRPLLDALEKEANAIFASAEERAKRAGVVAERAELEGSPASAILTEAQSICPDLIVMGTHGRRGFERFAVGSTAEDVIRASSVPVFVVPKRADKRRTGPLTRALVAVDGSPAAELALRFACDLARAEGTRVTLCGVIDEVDSRWDDLDRSEFLEVEKKKHAKRLLDESKALAQSLGADVATSLRQGKAADEILAAAAGAEADCIMMGTHGRAGIPRFILGSVAEGVLRASTVPVCAIRQRGA